MGWKIYKYSNVLIAILDHKLNMNYQCDEYKKV